MLIHAIFHLSYVNVCESSALKSHILVYLIIYLVRLYSRTF